MGQASSAELPSSRGGVKGTPEKEAREALRSSEKMIVNLSV